MIIMKRISLIVMIISIIYLPITIANIKNLFIDLIVILISAIMYKLANHIIKNTIIEDEYLKRTKKDSY